MEYRMALVLVTLNDHDGHSPIAGLFKCNPSNICKAFYHISTDSMLPRSLGDSWASCLQIAPISLIHIKQSPSFYDQP